MLKVGHVPIKLSRPLPSTPSSVTVIKDASGRYFASFVVDVESEPTAVEAPKIGVDLGLKHFAVLSDGTKIDAPRFLRKAEAKLKRLQRALARKKEGSANREKARVKLARARARVADARRDFHHQLSTRLIRENQAIAVENSSVSGLARTSLAKSVLDAGWASFTAMLEYKAAQRATLRSNQSVRTHLADLLELRDRGRPQATACAHVAVQGLRGVAG